MKISGVSFRSWLRNLKSQSSLLFLSALSMALLCGSLMVGFSVEQSLKNIGFNRLGKARYLATPPFSVTQGMVSHFASLPGESAAMTSAKAISVSSSGISIPNVMVYGVNQDFFNLYNQPIESPGKNEVFINSKLADRLNLKEGMNLIINLKNDSLIPLEIPLSGGESGRLIITVKIKKILKNRGPGNFSVNIGSQIDDIIYINHKTLSEEMERPGMYSMILLEKLPEGDINRWISEHWSLKDLGLLWSDMDEEKELRSENLFISPSLLNKINSDQGELISSGFIISVTGSNNATPYSFFTTNETLSDGIIISRWLSEDSGLLPGDTARITYWSSGKNNRLTEKQISVPVLSVIDDQIMGEKKDRLPPFPGLSSSASCNLWDPGVPVDLDVIRDKDEKWWNLWGASPRIILPLNLARYLNEGPYGSVTGIRFDKNETDIIEKSILSAVIPSEEGYIFTDLYEAIQRGSREGVDFSGLFTGLNFFLILSCLYLLLQTQVLTVNKKQKEISTLKSLGFSRIKIIQWFMTQFISTITLALIPGVLFAVMYQYFILQSLNSIWSGAVAGTSLSFAWNLPLMFIGLTSAWILSLLGALWVLLSELNKKIKKIRRETINHSPILIITVLLIILAIFFSIWLYFEKNYQPAAFFVSGLTILLLCFSLFNLFFLNRESKLLDSISSLSITEMKRNKSSVRSQFLLYSGSLFLLLTLTLPFGSGKNNPGGTGGYDYYGETAITYPSNNALINISGFDGKVIGFRKFDGDDASCLNLNRVFQPSILGAPAYLLEKENKFTFSSSINKNQQIWTLLDQVRDDGKIPAIADETVLIWNLKAAVGDTMFIKDEKGRERELIFIAALSSSIFQGNVLIGENHFKELFPKTSGYKVMLFESQMDREILERLLKPWGSYISSTTDRLEQFAQVEHNYLKIFANLGFIALILGSLGTGLHLISRIRNNEAFWSLLNALGYSVRQRWTWLFFQSVPSLILAFFSSAVSVLVPMIIWSISSSVKLSWVWFLTVIVGLLLFMLLSLFIIFRILLKTPLLRGLRNL